MTSIAADFESENTSRCQKAGKENLRNIPKKVNVGNGDAKKLFKSPKPSSKMSETAVEIQPEEKLLLYRVMLVKKENYLALILIAHRFKTLL